MDRLLLSQVAVLNYSQATEHAQFWFTCVDVCTLLYAYDVCTLLYAYDVCTLLYAYDVCTLLYACDVCTLLYAYDVCTLLYAYDVCTLLYAYDVCTLLYAYDVCTLLYAYRLECGISVCVLELHWRWVQLRRKCTCVRYDVKHKILEYMVINIDASFAVTANQNTIFYVAFISGRLSLPPSQITIFILSQIRLVDFT